MHKEKFKGPAIPFGAKVVFKPKDARKREQSTKFDPKGLIGVFAGYVVEAGQKWSRKMLVWNLVDFKKVNLAFDCERVPMVLQKTTHHGESGTLIANHISPEDGV